MPLSAAYVGIDYFKNILFELSLPDGHCYGKTIEVEVWKGVLLELELGGRRKLYK